MSSPRRGSARERVQQRRSANRKRRSRSIGSWTQFALAAGALIILALLAVGAQLWRRTDDTLATIQQEDPRQRRPTSTPVPELTPTLAPRQATASVPAGQPTPRGTAQPVPAAMLPAELQKPINVLLIGVDKRPDPDDGARSDTLILVRLNP
ncbi:MAG TPA: hypothetical protein VFT99_06835, partial [Roseiflexaceae bacterium]|nr:hypothetical protein [Roseiflexaceae bacterium]